MSIHNSDKKNGDKPHKNYRPLLIISILILFISVLCFALIYKNIPLALIFSLALVFELILLHSHKK